MRWEGDGDRVRSSCGRFVIARMPVRFVNTEGSIGGGFFILGELEPGHGGDDGSVYRVVDSFKSRELAMRAAELRDAV